MELYQTIFNKQAIYDTLFFNIKAVLEYPTLDDLKEKNINLYSSWGNIAISKYHDPEDNDFYQKVAPSFHEFVKIVAITYGKVILNKDDGKLKSINLLEYGPKEVDGSYYCINNKVEFTEDYVRSICNVKKNIYV
jgi:hypothetical protein